MTLPVTHLDHIADGTSKVISQYQGRPKLMSRIACYLNLVQQVEDAYHAIHEAFRPETATGFRLDWIGKKVGQPRVSADDNVYRKYIFGRIRANRSLGQIPDIEAVAKLLLSRWWYRELSLHIEVETDDALTPTMSQAVQSMLQRAAPAGVRVYLIVSIHPWFEFTTAAEGVLSGHGFDTVAGLPDAGLLSEVF